MRRILITFVITALFLFSLILFQKINSDFDDSEIVIGTAASLKDVMTELRDCFVEQNIGANIKISFAATGTIRTQIEQGAPIDVFASANKFFGCQTQDYEQIVKKESIRGMCGNALVLVKNIDLNEEEVDFLNSKEFGKIALGDPAYVPAGKYAKSVLTRKRLWEINKGKFVYANNVRQVLTWVKQGVVPSGFVYRTDAVRSEKIKIIEKFDLVNGKEIYYPIALTKNVRNHILAQEFIDYVLSNSGKKILEKHGFITF